MYEKVAHTPAQLRAVLEAARRDPAVLAFPYTQYRELVGEPPQRCRRGHLYAQPDQPYPAIKRGWLACSCGGHVVYRCQVSQDGRPCQDELIDPPRSYDCEATRPTPDAQRRGRQGGPS